MNNQPVISKSVHAAALWGCSEEQVRKPENSA
jgi:hypothetical protein